jgi:hypothetical protein
MKASPEKERPRPGEGRGPETQETVAGGHSKPSTGEVNPATVTISRDPTVVQSWAEEAGVLGRIQCGITLCAGQPDGFVSILGRIVPGDTALIVVRTGSPDSGWRGWRGHDFAALVRLQSALIADQCERVGAGQGNTTAGEN